MTNVGTMAAQPSQAPIWQLVTALVMTVVIAACTTTTYESFRPIKNRNVDIAYVGENVDFSKYRRLMFEEMGIFYPTGSPTSEGDLERVRDAFRSAFLQRVADYEIVDRPAADVVKTAASLVDLRNATAAQVPDIGRDINQILQPGKLTFMIEMRDSQSNALLLRAADTSRSPRIDASEHGAASSSDVEAAAQHWADLFGNFLDTNLRGQN